MYYNGYLFTYIRFIINDEISFWYIGTETAYIDELYVHSLINERINSEINFRFYSYLNYTENSSELRR